MESSLKSIKEGSQLSLKDYSNVTLCDFIIYLSNVL